MDQRLARGLKYLGWLGTATRILLVIYSVLALIIIAAGLYALLIAKLHPLQILPALLSASILVTSGLSFPLAGIAFLFWTYRAHSNLRLLGLTGLSHSPGWAVASFLVPGVNLFVPFAATRALYNRSAGEIEELAWISVPDVTSWWTCFLIGNFIHIYFVVRIILETATPAYLTTPPLADVILAVFSLLLLIGAAIYLFRIIGAITRNQKALNALVATTFD